MLVWNHRPRRVGLRVEGHSVHRVATFHRATLVGKTFRASSPNGRFTDGAAKIDGRLFRQIEAVGKNLFAFFGIQDDTEVVVHVHFDMAGAWPVWDAADAPSPTTTTRLILEGHGLIAHLSAMTVTAG